MQRISIALVEYLNTLPFSEGIRLSGLEKRHDIMSVPPAACAALFSDGTVDISLCPVGALADLPAYKIVSDYCIGADGDVRSVRLLSKVPVEQIQQVRLDAHSRTSNLLLQILAQRYWKKQWTFIKDSGQTDMESCLMIGDKVFEHEKEYTYHYDLALTWKELTGLPMVFAVWIIRPGIDMSIVSALDEAFAMGMQTVFARQIDLPDWQFEYLTKNISYTFDTKKREALTLYQQWVKELPIPSSERQHTLS